jgi:SWI/SNF-related matrix-associated actin-dependent regulator of chromatin subfamily A-like protein 1
MQQVEQTQSLQQNTIEAAILALSARDTDHAAYDNGVGFNGRDTQFGNSLGEQIRAGRPLSPKQRFFAYKMLRTYRVQLSNYGVDYSAIEAPFDPSAPVRQWFALDASGAVLGSLGTQQPDNEKAAAATIAAYPGAVRAECAIFHGGTFDPRQAQAQTETRPIPANPHRRLSLDADTGRLVFRFAYDAAVKDAVKATGARFEKAMTDQLSNGRQFGGPSVWSLTPRPSIFEQVEQVVKAHCFDVDADAQAKIDEIVGEARGRLEASKAASSDFDVPTLGCTLYPFQRAGVEYAVRTKRVLFGDQMGLGKTPELLATVEALNAYPFLVIVPASLKINWYREARKFLPHRRTVVLDGKELNPAAADLYVINYDVLGRAIKPKHKGDDYEFAWRPAIAALKARGLAGIGFDEFHYCKNYQAQRSRLCRELAKGLDVRIGLTGTPILNRPNELIEPLQILGRLNDLGGFKNFMTRYCGWTGEQGSGEGATALQELNQKLRSTCYVRREKSEVLTELPAKRRTVVPLELSNRSEYDRAEAELIKFIGEQAIADARKRIEIAEEVDDEILTGEVNEADRDAEIEHRMRAYAADKMFKGRAAEKLRRYEVLKQVSARGKLAEAAEWIRNFVEGGEKLVVFGSHYEIIDAIVAEFGCKRITGQESIEERQAAVDDFQSNPESQVIAMNLIAGGVGLTLTAASNVAFLELGWNPGQHDQAEDRVHRIGQRDAVTAWYLNGERTIDEDIADLIEQKRAIVNETTTGNAASDVAGSIMADLDGRMMARAAAKQGAGLDGEDAL